MKLWWRPIIAAVLLAVILAVPIPDSMRFFLMLVPYFLAGFDVLYAACGEILHGKLLDENFLMAVATVVAFCKGEYSEAVFVMIFYQIGERFQSVAVGKSRRSIKALLSIRAEYAHIEKNGKIETVSPEMVAVGDVFVVRPGEKVPTDGIVLSGQSTLDVAALTGESVPRAVGNGDRVQSGCINIDGILKVRAEATYDASTAAKILELVQSAAKAKAKPEAFITKFARVYTPAVVLCALVIGVIPPLFGGEFSVWIYRALSFLVVSCPCALVISVPLAYFGGIGGNAKRGILIKGASYLEALAQAETVVFDKTGTLTKGEFKVTKIHAESVSEAMLLAYATALEVHSNHPIAKSVMAAYGKEPPVATEIREVAGEGISAKVDNQQISVGNMRLMKRMAVQCKMPKEAGTAVHVAVDGQYAGYLIIEDVMKEDAKKAIDTLKKLGVRRTVLLTGDRKEVGDKVGHALGIDDVYAELMPAEKAAHLETYLEKAEGSVLYIGDGINDAPVLARADVGVAMGAFGTDAAIEAADVVLMDDKIMKLCEAIRLAKKTRRIVTVNILFAIGIKLVVLSMSAYGLADMWMAVFADVGVSVLAVLNAMRMLKNKVDTTALGI